RRPWRRPPAAAGAGARPGGHRSGRRCSRRSCVGRPDGRTSCRTCSGQGGTGSDGSGETGGPSRSIGCPRRLGRSRHFATCDTGQDPSHVPARPDGQPCSSEAKSVPAVSPFKAWLQRVSVSGNQTCPTRFAASEAGRAVVDWGLRLTALGSAGKRSAGPFQLFRLGGTRTMAKWGAVGCTVPVVLAGIVGLMAVGTYNTLNSLDQAVRAQWSQVENVYQRRADLVPNLVETVKGAASFEKDTFTAVAEARSKVGQV